MASLRQLQSKVKTFKDFQKVVNIQKIVVMKEIIQWKARIEQAEFRRHLFVNRLIEINNHFHVFDSSIFNTKKTSIPIKRDIHFILVNPPEDKLGDYANKLIVEYCKKNNSPDDIYVIVGNGLDESFRRADLNVIKVMKDAKMEDVEIYARIAFQILRGHSDMLFHRAKFIFLNAIEKRIVEEPLFPFERKIHEFTKEEQDKFTDDMKILLATNVKKVTFYKDIERVANTIISEAINMQVYAITIQYRLAMCMRELQALDDKEKNIQAEIETIKLKMQRVRKDNITNELLTNAVAFGALSKSSREKEDEV